jgi:hypothetical protein
MVDFAASLTTIDIGRMKASKVVMGSMAQVVPKLEPIYEKTAPYLHDWRVSSPADRLVGRQSRTAAVRLTPAAGVPLGSSIF